jgi:hypothetical protein
MRNKVNPQINENKKKKKKEKNIFILIEEFLHSSMGVNLVDQF